MHLGLRSFIPHPISVALAPFLTKLPTAPPSVNYHSQIVLPGDPLGNNDCGDCFWAGVYRQAQLRMAVAWGSSWTPAPSAVIGTYSAVTGYDPLTGAGDNGTDLDQGEGYVYQTGLQTGLQGPDVGMPIQLDPANAELLDTATWLFGGIGEAWALPLGIQGNTTLWDVPLGAETLPEWKPGSWGGHYTASGRYSRSSSARRPTISWGIEIPVTQRFMGLYLAGAVAYLSRDWIQGGVVAPSGLDWDQLEAAARAAGS